MVVGREKLIKRLWKKLEKHSLRLTAERRVGKTTVLKEMARHPVDGVLAVFIDLEGVSSPLQFAETLMTYIKPHLSKDQKALTKFSSLMQLLGGVEIGGVIKLPESSEIDWQTRVEKLLDGLSSCQPDVRIDLLFDELPYMLQKIWRDEHHAGETHNNALALLDVLRAKRKPPSNLRMVYSGSVGLHHVISALRDDAVAAEPFNDMPIQEIRGLDEIDSHFLASKLLQEEGVETEELKQLATSVAKLGDHVPFYIERIVSRLADLERSVTSEDALLVFTQQLTDDQDEWEMEHFRSRIPIYYPGHIVDLNGHTNERAEIVVRILDAVAQKSPQSIDEVWEDVKSAFALSSRSLVVRLLKSLAQDHYLHSDVTKRYSFRYELLRNWWLCAQGLSQGLDLPS